MNIHNFVASVVGVFCLLFAITVEAGNDKRADYSVRLFFEKCIAEKADVNLISASIISGNDFSLALLPDSKAKLFLNNAPGKAWGAAVPFGNFILSIQDNGLCSVYIRQVDSLAIKEQFLWAINYIAGKSGKIEKISEEPLKQKYGLLQQYTYKVINKEGLGNYNAVLSTTDSNTAPLQAIMSIAHAQ